MVAIDDLAKRSHPTIDALRMLCAPPILGRMEPPPRDYNGSISPTGKAYPHIVGFTNV